LSLTAQVKAIERSSGKVLLDRKVVGFTVINVGSDLASSERQKFALVGWRPGEKISRPCWWMELVTDRGYSRSAENDFALNEIFGY